MDLKEGKAHDYVSRENFLKNKLMVENFKKVFRPTELIQNFWCRILNVTFRHFSSYFQSRLLPLAHLILYQNGQKCCRQFFVGSSVIHFAFWCCPSAEDCYSEIWNSVVWRCFWSLAISTNISRTWLVIIPGNENFNNIIWITVGSWDNLNLCPGSWLTFFCKFLHNSLLLSDPFTPRSVIAFFAKIWWLLINCTNSDFWILESCQTAFLRLFAVSPIKINVKHTF